MDNEKVIKGLKQMKTYCSSNLVDILNYAIQVFQKLEIEGIKEPLDTDFSKIKEGKTE